MEVEDLLAAYQQYQGNLTKSVNQSGSPSTYRSRTSCIDPTFQSEMFNVLCIFLLSYMFNVLPLLLLCYVCVCSVFQSVPYSDSKNVARLCGILNAKVNAKISKKTM